MPPDMSYMVLADIAKLRKMPELAKRIEEYQPTPDPMAQERIALEIELLRAQIVNEQAKGQENAVDVGLKTAKTATEEAKARNLNSGYDNADLDFVEKESGVANALDQEASDRKHSQTMEGKEHDRLANLDTAAFNALNKPTNQS